MPLVFMYIYCIPTREQCLPLYVCTCPVLTRKPQEAHRQSAETHRITQNTDLSAS